MSKKIAFFGTSEFGVETLLALHKEFGVEFVVTGKPKPANRGQKVVNTPIFELAESLGIKRVYTPEKLTHEFEEYLADIDYAVVVSFGMIIPQNILDSAKNFINLHPSSLPLFRGAAPIERTIEHGYKETDVCVINMTKKLDAGDIIAKEKYQISENENSIDLHKKFGEIGSRLIIKLIKNGSNICEKQDDSIMTYAKKIEKSELELVDDITQASQSVLNKIRAFASCGFCFKLHNGKRFKFISAQFSYHRLTPLDVECFDGFASPLKIRPEGKGDLSIKDYQFV